MKSASGWSGLSGGVITVVCGVLAACSQAPPEPAPEFTLPLSQVTPTPPMQGEASADERTAPRRLRYVVVPPGEHVAGMAHARIVVKHGKRASHHPHHAHRKTVAPAAAVKKPTETDEPAAKP